jgi:transposase-like protein
MEDRARDVNRVISARIVEWCGEKDISLKRFALIAGVNPSTVYSLTGGQKNGMSASTVARICRAHGIDANWLLGLKG